MAAPRTESIETLPYEQLAALYDYVMRHVDYVEWADYIEQVFAWCRVKPQTVTESACGTGSLALILGDRGYNVEAYDLSEAMLNVARGKTPRTGASPPVFSQADMKNLPPGEADALLCLYDSVNYCLTTGELKAAFRSFRNAVREGGIGVFDVTTEANSLRYFRDFRCREQHAGFTISRHSVFHRETGLQTNEFLFVDAERQTRVKELHRQRIYSLQEILESVPNDCWSVLGAFDGFTFEPPDEDSERIHIVMRAVS